MANMTEEVSANDGKAQTIGNTGYCLLSLDGGDVRGLSTLYILQNTMNRLNHMREEAGLDHKKPCKIFGIIGATSTGEQVVIFFLYS
jgi:patatin-like phospholipase/acyl hydrolase